MIEKRITHQLLDAGELVLTTLERESLQLPEHSSTIDVELEGETFHAQWSGRSRQLSGDLLTERLQDYGQDGGLLRLRLVDQTYRLTLLPPGTPLQVTHTPPPPRRLSQTPAAKKARRRATVDRQFHPDKEYDWDTADSPKIGFLTEARNLVGDQLKAAGFDPLDIVELRLQGEELATLDDFEELLAVDVANVDRMPHQEAVARHALSRLRGRAILADEVGLGKTIEAGLAVKELALRGLAKRVLILCPAPLRDQWREEMAHKFDLTFDVAYRGAEVVASQDKLILSLQLAAQQMDKLTKKPWDIVIVDEAHRAAGAGARKRRELITGLTAACRYAFFLTATPVQNDLLELYRLVELLRPGTFTSVGDFKRQYMAGYDKRTPTDPAALRRLISSVMIRTTRAQAGVDRVVRRAVDVPVALGSREQELYALSTDLLRNVMRDPGDTMRRRSLALRLTASPFSMGTTALRMAERHSNERVRRVLNEVGHLAMDIKASARENRALEIAHGWLREHGRVLIFTQHTDTVTGLLRRMEAEGIRARSFHGSMSATERASTIAAFRSGEAPVMISTDAGAEGQNLQFCNCVLNYDLPWNPMRIEQRIGRVDRLTQPCDEVFVANLYARSTIDEQVYRLLAEKLRMFELLFGQVTTILGELDDSKSASFETRVMEALFAESDTKMERLLTELGAELIDARQRASTMIAADSGLSSWMAEAFEHRKELTKEGGAELLPEVSERTRRRQRRVQTWVREMLHALGAIIMHDTGEGDGAFLTVQFNEEFEAELGGRTLMHLAFDRYGLDHHPDAELCAVGSPIFDELLGLLRMRGDLHASVPIIPDDIGPTPYRHSANTSLVRRRLVPSGRWNGQATFRATIGEAETTEHVITAEINPASQPRLSRRSLEDGEVLPAAFGDPFKVVTQFEQAAARQLAALRRDRAKEIENQQARELRRVQSGYTAQIAEASREDRPRLQRALQSEERRLTRPPDVRARAKLLAITLDENDWVIEETWSGPKGVERTLTYEWGLEHPPSVMSETSQRSIDVLALCVGSHWSDATEIVQCESCGDELCGACGDNATLTDCPICKVQCCGACRTGTGGLCLRCGIPERAPDLDKQYAKAWRMNRGAMLLVGRRASEITLPGEKTARLVVRDEDVSDPHRIAVRSYALHNGLPADCGLGLRDLTDRPSSNETERLLLHSHPTITTELSVADDGGESIDARAAGELPKQPEPSVIAEQDMLLGRLLDRLRDEDPPPASPAVLVTRRAKFVDTYLEADGLVEQVSVVADDGSLTTVDQGVAPTRWREQSIDDATLGEGELGDVRVTLRRRNDAVLISAHIASSLGETFEWLALPESSSAIRELASFELLFNRGMPGGRIGNRKYEDPTLAGPFPTPSECELGQRTIHPIAQIVDVDEDSELAPINDESLAAVSANLDGGRRTHRSVPGELNRALLGRANRSFTCAVYNGFEVREEWRGHGTATHVYQTFDAETVAPKLDDVGFRGTDFGVCRDGHFYGVGTAALCAACGTWACRACDEVEQQATMSCPSCSADVCRRCRMAEHQVSQTVCVLCADHACAECGRDPEVRGCQICDRAMCANCRTDDLCPACVAFTPATETQVRQLPPELALSGATVQIGSDANATSIVLDRGEAIEQALIRDGSVARWVAFGRAEIDDAYRLRLSASAALKAQVVPFTESLAPEPKIAEPHLLLNSQRSYQPLWFADALGLSGRAEMTFGTPVNDLAHTIGDAFPVMEKTPQAVAAVPQRVVDMLASVPRPESYELRLAWHRTGSDLAVVSSGLRKRSLDGSEMSETEEGWAPAEDVPDWVLDSWAPTPAVHAKVTAGNTEVAVVGMASALALGVQEDTDTFWHVIVASPHACAASALARSMDLGDADFVGPCTDPTRLRLSTVANAVNTELQVHPVGSFSSAFNRDLRNDTETALNVWLPSEPVRMPDLSALAADFRHTLEQRFRSMTPRRNLNIGAHVVQVGTVESGQTWRYEKDLLPGQTDARRFDDVTGLVLSEGVIDREGHFGSTATQCLYCSGRICDRCESGVVACGCCGIRLCRQCVRGTYEGLQFCPACAGLRQPSRGEARQHGRWLSTRGMLIGTDDHHTVVLEHSKLGWGLHSDAGTEQRPIEIEDASLTKFLTELSG
ncbi:superfamily II DNA or RNA helicase [Mycobacterium sp. OAS707]|uniref:DEAD/DEAH box helicase n=1 Tax=Mycobacterium sp. OAS707 TaxID=2663822 RepID=UPI00178B1B68|nr:helicase-related protein [Mycobacterium sp. OAS707]MBE1552929.1 superfamily II DNA or RNA helicase [Mycobacterium sp. OAS707]